MLDSEISDCVATVCGWSSILLLTLTIPISIIFAVITFSLKTSCPALEGLLMIEATVEHTMELFVPAMPGCYVEAPFFRQINA